MPALWPALISNATEVTNIFNDYFASVFTVNDGKYHPLNDNDNDTEFD